MIPSHTSPSPSVAGTEFSAQSVARVRDYIERGWPDTVRTHTDDEGTLLGLPFAYTVPCRKQMFQELYYWDTYFTTLGLVHSPRGLELAEDNLRNFVHEISRHGFIPNGNRTYYLNRSQPPYLGALVRLLSEHGSEFARSAQVVDAMRREHVFWVGRRGVPIGLSRYGHQADPDYVMQFFGEIRERAYLAGGDEAVCRQQAGHALAECESGWDFNRRFDQRCEDFCPIDLNCNLYLLECALAEFAPLAERSLWQERSLQRQELINRYCWDEQAGGFFDYDHIRLRRSPVVSAASFHPLWAGLATQQQAERTVRVLLPQIEQEYGIAACARASDVFGASGAPTQSGRVYQWDYPNIWPCLQLIVYRGLLRYGYDEEARRIAQKYVATVCRGFESSGDLWEKYNALSGSHHACNDNSYEAPAMMGWTAGVFIDALSLLQA